MTDWKSDMKEAFMMSRKIAAIKATRSKTGMGLKQAKDLVEKYYTNDEFATDEFRANRAEMLCEEILRIRNEIPEIKSISANARILLDFSRELSQDREDLIGEIFQGLTSLLAHHRTMEVLKNHHDEVMALHREKPTQDQPQTLGDLFREMMNMIAEEGPNWFLVDLPDVREKNKNTHIMDIIQVVTKMTPDKCFMEISKLQREDRKRLLAERPRDGRISDNLLSALERWENMGW